MRCDRVLNKVRYENLETYLASFNRIEEDWVKWMSNFVEIVSELTNYKIDDKSIITFYLYSESVLTGSKPGIIHRRFIFLNDSGRLVIGLMSKVKSFDCLTIEEKKLFAWCILGSCYLEETGIEMFSSVNNVLYNYDQYSRFVFETLDGFPQYDYNEPLGSINNPVIAVTPNDALNYINQLGYKKQSPSDEWTPYCFFDSIAREEHVKGLHNEQNLTLYKIEVRHFNPRMSCVNRQIAQLQLFVNESGIKNSINPPKPVSVSYYVNSGERSYPDFIFKTKKGDIPISKIGPAFSEFSMQCTLSDQTWHECGLKSPSEFGSFSSFFSSKESLLKRVFLQEEFQALATGILVRDFVDAFPSLLSDAEFFANMVLGFHFAVPEKSNGNSLFKAQLSLKDYLYLNLSDTQIFIDHASSAGFDIENDKLLLDGIAKLMNYCYRQSKSFIKEHLRFTIINDLPK